MFPVRWPSRTTNDIETGQQRYSFLVQAGNTPGKSWETNRLGYILLIFALFLLHYIVFRNIFYISTSTVEYISQESSLPQIPVNIHPPQQTVSQNAKKHMSRPSRPLPRMDIVYSYVNGSDPVRLQAKLENLRQEQQNPSSKADFDTVSTLGLARDNNELLYSLRSIKQYLPWFNGVIHIVTDQIPSWLNASHEQIRIVRTSDILPKSHLPTFNSHGIEANLHRIPGLAEHFLYFNDDYLLGSTIPQNYYMNFKSKENDDVCLLFYHDDRPTLSSDISDQGPSIHYQAMKNVNQLLDKKFGPKERFYLPHAPHLFRRSALAELEQTFQPQFDQTSKNKFRSWTDIHSAYLFANFMVENSSSCAQFKKMRNKCYFNQDYCIKLLTGLDDAQLFFTKIKSAKRQWKFMSINDHVPDDSLETDLIMQLFQDYLQWKYPSPSPWEV